MKKILLTVLSVLFILSSCSFGGEDIIPAPEIPEQTEEPSFYSEPDFTEEFSEAEIPDSEIRLWFSRKFINRKISRKTADSLKFPFPASRNCFAMLLRIPEIYTASTIFTKAWNV